MPVQTTRLFFLVEIFQNTIMKQVVGNIKNIIFDLGGVLLDINPELSIQAFRKLGMPDLIKPGGWSYEHDVFLNMEQGLLSKESFRDGIRELLPQPASDELIDEAWCAMIIDFPEEKIELLRQLKSKYRLYLFSNTNSIHINYFHTIFKKKFSYSLSDLFVKDYYSSEIGMRKPGISSFQFVLNDAGLNPSETLFIDDAKANVESAGEAGMQTLWLHPELDLLSVF